MVLTTDAHVYTVIDRLHIYKITCIAEYWRRRRSIHEYGGSTQFGAKMKGILNHNVVFLRRTVTEKLTDNWMNFVEGCRAYITGSCWLFLAVVATEN